MREEIFTPDTWTVRPSTFGEIDPSISNPPVRPLSIEDEMFEYFLDKCLKGFALLDEHKPGWREELRPHVQERQFQMRDGKYCALGFLYGDFWNGVRHLFGNNDGQEDWQYGFNANFALAHEHPEWFKPDWDDVSEIAAEQFSMLQEIWEAEILKVQA